VFEDGRREHRDIPFAKGAPEAPIPDGELIDKAMGLLSPAIGAARARQVVDAVWDLERCADVSQVTRLLAVQGTAA